MRSRIVAEQHEPEADRALTATMDNPTSRVIMTSDSVSTDQGEPEPEPNPQSGGGTQETSAEVDRRRRIRRRWGFAIFAVVATAIVAALFLVQLPYYVIQPGSVRPSEQRIHISGAKSFETPGRVMFTTVYIDQASPALLIMAWLDSAAEIRSRSELYPNGDSVASQRQNVALMDASKVLATKVALSEEVFLPSSVGTGPLWSGW